MCFHYRLYVDSGAHKPVRWHLSALRWALEDHVCDDAFDADLRHWRIRFSDVTRQLQFGSPLPARFKTHFSENCGPRSQWLTGSS